MTADRTSDATPGSSVTFINVFEIDADQVDAFVAQWERRAALMSAKPGFLDSRLHRARSAGARFQLVNVSHWESREAWEAATADTEFQERTRAAREERRRRSRRTRVSTTWPSSSPP